MLIKFWLQLLWGKRIMAFVFTEFPHLSHHYNVGAVPKIVINDKVEFEGALPEKQYLDKLIEATNKV
jgi:predicted DsbA family dithiol-disulfide isomerase